MEPVRLKLGIDVPEDLQRLSATFVAAGHQLHLVGGAVRDAVMGLPPKDFDVATDATPDQVKRLLAPLGVSLLEVGAAFGVVAVVLPPPLHKLEIATFREDMTAGRRPEVRFASINEDVLRRDLTANALFYDLASCEVVDLVGGLDDIARGVVRTVGRPEDRFAEDRLRIMRAVRFASRFGWSIDPETEDAIARDPRLTGVSPERIHDELVKAIEGAVNPPRLFDSLERLGLWAQVLPGLKVSVGPDALVSTRGFDTNDPALALALLLDGEDVRALGKKLLALKHSRDEVLRVTSLLEFRDMDARRAHVLKQALGHVDLTREQMSEYMVQRGMPDRHLFSAFVRYLDAPATSGDTLLAEGYSGRALGEELRRREAVLFEGLVTHV